VARKEKTKAFAYLRTSSAANVGADKDSDKRQREAIARFAREARLEVVQEFYDADVSGADPIETRPGFAELLDRVEANGVRVVVVEDATRFARGLVTQEAGIVALIERGVLVLTASGDNLTETDDPFKIAMRQMAGVFAQLQKSRLVAKLKVARDRKRAAGVKCGGRKNYAERSSEAVALARELRHPRGKRPLSLRKVAAELAAKGFLAVPKRKGDPARPYGAAAVARMLGASA
jgi:DNA invertase Pin-like site-specific DNA recombinase